MDINLHIFVLVILMLAWAFIAILIYRAGSRALETKTLTGLETMIGSRGRVVQALQPLGMVRVKGELWQAQTDKGKIAEGEEIEVVDREGKKLIVQPVE